jgi:oxygen-independent coproporphyrinogen III oxidase
VISRESICTECPKVFLERPVVSENCSGSCSAQDPRQIDQVLRARYDVRGPRYTSYPPATQFQPLAPAKIFEQWQKRNRLNSDPGLSLYVHIPFCRSRCLFCGCHTFVGQKAPVMERYLAALCAEMEIAGRVVSRDRIVRQVALGGGTPNAMSAAQTDRVLTRMRQLWQIASDAELSVEIDARTATPEKLAAFLDHGFNRFSLGIQDFSEEVLRLIRRGQEFMQVEEVVGFLRSRGCHAINFDLIYGLAGQDLQTSESCASRVVALRPSRIALYNYAHLPNMFPHQKALEQAGLPDPDLKAQIFLTMMDTFLSAGYTAIGMDHFALPEDPLAIAMRQRTLRRNFMGYHTGRGLDLLAFGASAISSIGPVYSQNDKTLAGYQEMIDGEILPIVRGFLLSRDDEIRRNLLLDLFCNFRADLDALSRQFDIDAISYFSEEMERLKPMEADGLLSVSPQCIDVTAQGRFFIRNICMTFDRYLGKDGNGRMYSRTL